MLAGGFDVNMANDDGLSALHNACCDGHISAAQLLLDKGANVNAADEVCISLFQPDVQCLPAMPP
jgi:ankyrin repeat protein